jgi:oligoendopeptidase F
MVLMKGLVAAVGVIMTVAAVAVAGGDKVKVEDTWKLEDLYASRQDFTAARDALAKRLPELAKAKGTLGSSPKALKAALDTYFDLGLDLNKLFAYAGMKSDEDTRLAEPMADRQEVGQLATEYSAAASWLAPEILALPAGTVAKFLAAEPGLAPYRFYLEDLERQRAHTLSPEGEKLLAQAGLMAPAAGSVYGVLANADMPFPEVTLSDGTKVRLDQAAYSKYRGSPNREDRIKVFAEFWKTYKAYERTFGATLDASVKRDLFYAKARNYPNCLASALDSSNVPEAVYRTLVAEANRALPTLHRAFRLRARMLGIKDLAYYDIYPPIVSHIDRKFTLEEAKGLALDAMAPLGKDYTDVVRGGFDSRWMDAYPHQGKRAGAYSTGVYGTHPYVLLNYNDNYEGVSTLAHEWGHAMHTYLANAAQPYPTSDYSIFVAEVASTFNEALLLDRMLKTAKSDDEKLSLLGSYLENMRGTFFRQTMFAEFELAIHEAAERGEALTGEKLSTMYGELLRRYHGQADGVMKIDDAYTVEWAFIPHFYRNFYVFQYATSLTASTALAQEVLDGKPGAREHYLGLLKAGGSRYPYELLKDAGVDLASPAPYRALEKRMSWAMDEMEKILAKQGK